MKKAIIIGAKSGIGKELARIFAANNYLVGITGRRIELLEKLKSERPNSFFIQPLDVTVTSTVGNNLDDLTAELGGVDLVILCSGIGEINEQLDFEIELQTINTNVIGFTCAADWAFNRFEIQEFGHLVAISSIGGIRGSRIAPAYNASKSFQINYLEGLQQKATKLKKPIYITDIRPGLVNTAMAKGEGIFWVMPVEKTAMQIFTAIKRKKKMNYVTKRWRLIAALLKRLPAVIYERM